MAKLVAQCPICSKQKVSEVKHFSIGKSRFITLDCGHTYKEQLSITESDSIVLKDGKELYPFQVEGVHFAERSGFSCLIGDEQGLGKTIQATGLMSLHLEELKPVLIVVKASLTVQWQKYILQQLDKFAQIVTTRDKFIPNLSIYITTYDTVGKLDFGNIKINTLILDECQMIKNHDAKRTNAIRSLVQRKITKIAAPISAKEESERVARAEMMANDLFSYHGIAGRFKYSVYNNMGRTLGLTKCKVVGEGIIHGEIILNKDHIEKDPEEEVLETILHEIAHAITPGAGHIDLWKETSISIGGNGKAIANCSGSVELAKIEVSEPQIKNKLFLSGTPIKNNAIEYWPALNLLRPEMFPVRSDWLQYEVGYWLSTKGVWKPGGLKYPEQFREKTKDFIVRRERAEVFPELPSITRDFRYYEIGRDEMQAYTMGVKKLEDFLKNANQKDFNFNSQLQGHLMILRHITGLAKIAPILELIDDEFVANKADEPWKLPIFHTHIDVGSILQKHINDREIGNLRITANDSAAVRYEKLDRLRNDPNIHILLIPSLASAEGYDLDFCETGVLLEREWNPANEEQVEGRFIRATTEMLEKARKGDLKATLIYPVAVNTTDEFFAELVERKRVNIKETLRGETSNYNWDESQIMLDLARIAIERAKRI